MERKPDISNFPEFESKKGKTEFLLQISVKIDGSGHNKRY